MKTLKLLIICLPILASCSKNEPVIEEPDENPVAAFQDSLNSFFSQPQLSEKVVFLNVNVVTMTSENPLVGQDVFISNGRIEGIEPAGTGNNTGYEQVDASGKYLIPGLADMHIHPAVSSNMPYDMFLFVANGVTTTRVMWGADEHVRTRDQINSGNLFGPRMYVASAGFDGLNNTWPGAINTTSVSDVKSRIDQLSSKNYDFIKIYSGINTTQYAELVDYAWSKGIPPIGHVPSTVDVSDALSKMSSISHLGKFRSSSLPEDQLYTQLAQSTTTICPTMTVIHRNVAEQHLYKDEWYDLVSPAGINVYDLTEATLLPDNSWYFTINQVLRKIIAAEATIIAGTDMGIRLVIPGVSLHEELGYYVFAGMSNYEALRTATVNPANFVNDGTSGTIEIGKKANLVLLNSNPLEDIDNVGDISGVMNKGQWLSKTEIDQVLSWIKGFYGR